MSGPPKKESCFLQVQIREDFDLLIGRASEGLGPEKWSRRASTSKVRYSLCHVSFLDIVGGLTTLHFLLGNTHVPRSNTALCHSAICIPRFSKPAAVRIQLKHAKRWKGQRPDVLVLTLSIR
jgi:hypothetical protein